MTMMHVRINIINSETLVHWVTRIYAEHKNLGKERNMVWEIMFYHHGRIIELCESWHHVRYSYKWKTIRLNNEGHRKFDLIVVNLFLYTTYDSDWPTK